MNLFARWLRAFALTQIIEVPIYRRAFGSSLLEAFGASAITHPLVFWFNASHAWHVAWGWRAAACELFAWWVEALYFAVLGRRRVLAWTLIANSSSFLFGLGCWYLVGV
jgi:hypothetical protein